LENFRTTKPAKKIRRAELVPLLEPAYERDPKSGVSAPLHSLLAKFGSRIPLSRVPLSAGFLESGIEALRDDTG